MSFFPIEPSPKDIEDFKKVFGKFYDHPLSDQEAYEGAYDLLNAFKWLVDMDNKQKSKKPDQ